MPRSTKFEFRRPVSPYICSTPLDFSDERNFLSDVVFSKLSDLCRCRGAYFSPFDLHWEPGDAKTQKGLLLKTSLDAIKRCSQFFLCLLGETYGPFRNENDARLALPKNGEKLEIPEDCDWLDKNLILAATGSHPWVLQEGHQFRSVTELEVTQGALLCDSPYVTLYYRRSDHLESKRLLRSENTKDKDLSIYCSESEQARLRIHDLRQKLINKGVPVKYFSTLEELGNLVLKDWTEIIDMCLPPLLHDVEVLDTIEYREWMAQQSFMNSRSEVFVTTPDVEEILQQLTEFGMTCTRAENRGEGHDFVATAAWSKESHSRWAPTKHKKDLTHNNHTKSIMLLSGGRGVGKSALAVHWLNEFRADNSHICVISHFVSASNRSGDVIYFMRQCIRRLREQFLLSEHYDSNSPCADTENESNKNDESFLSLCEAFVAAIGLGPCVILLDGVNEFSSNKEFDWLPERLPATCKLIFTTTCSDISYRCLSQRPDTSVVNFPTSLTDTNTTVAMIRKNLPTVSQLIGGEQAVKRLAHLRIMQTALGSRVIGSELACYRVYSNMGVFMEECAEMWSLRNFWTMCVQNWVKEHSWRLTDQSPEHNFIDGGFDYSGWVIDSLCLIVVSRNGLNQDQVLSILKIIGYEGALEVTDYDWLQFRLAAGATLQELGDGCLVFGHKYLQEITEYLFFKRITSCTYDPVTIMKSVNLGRRQLYHEYLARYFSQQELNSQILEELLWHLMFSGDITSLANYLTNCQALLIMMSAGKDVWQEDLKMYWSVCQLSGHHPDLKYLQLMHAVEVVDINDVQVLEDKYGQSGVIFSADRIITSTPELSEPYHSEEVGQKLRGSFKISEATKAKDVADSIFVTQVVSGSHCQPHTFGVRQQKESLSDVASLGWYLAKFLQRIDQTEASSILLSSLIKYFKQVNCPLTTELYVLLCRCHHSLGKLQEESGDLDAAEKEYRLALHAVMAAINVDDEMMHQESTQYFKGLILNCHGNIRIHKKQLFESEELLKEALDCVIDNSDCVVLKSTIYFNLGIINSYQFDYQQAEFYLRQAIKLRSQWFGHNHSLVSDVLLALAKLLASPNNTKGHDVIQAKSLYKQVLCTQEKCFGASHLSVASVLFELGKLLAEENSRTGKLEAQNYLRRSLDITTTNLGGNHPVTIATQKILTKLDVALQLKNYEFGSNKHADCRSNKKPFSSLSQHESYLLRMLSRERSMAAAHSDDVMSFRSLSRDGMMNRRTPDSIMSTVMSLTSASERLLSAPVTEMPRLLWRKRLNQSEQGLDFWLPENCKNKGKKDIHDVVIGRVVANNRRIDVQNDLPHFDYDTNKNETDQISLKSDSAENVRAQLNQPIIGDIQQSQPITGDIQQNQPATGDIQQNQPATGDIQQNQPITEDIQQNQPITEDIQLNQQITEDVRQNQPITEDVWQNQQVTEGFQQKDGNGHVQKGNTIEMLDTPRLDSYADVTVIHNPSAMKKTVSLHPSSVTQKLFRRFERGSTLVKPQSRMTKSRNVYSSQQRLWSSQSSMTATSSFAGSHFSHCNIPGPHDITVSDSQTITGPHSCLTSLLGDPPCPRQISNRLHHMSAWYHVPGRYPTPQQPYPKKRMQRTKSATEIEAFIVLKSQEAKTKQHGLPQLEEKNISHLINQANNNSHMSNGTYLLHSRNSVLGSDNFSGYSRLNHKQNSPNSLMVSGLEILQTGYSENVSSAQRQAVKFKKHIVVG